MHFQSSFTFAFIIFSTNALNKNDFFIQTFGFVMQISFVDDSHEMSKPNFWEN